jgi:NodT family efflux transporter outer membrane factor (OMF) lipoprotein
MKMTPCGTENMTKISCNVSKMDTIKKTITTCLASVAFFVLSGCTMVGPDFTKPEAPIADAWSEQETTNNSGLLSKSKEDMDYRDWWKVFQDPVLDSLIKKAYEDNPTLHVAGLRVLEARALLGYAEGTLFPQHQAITGDVLSNGLSKNDVIYTPGMDRYYPRASLGFQASWEIDFWGRFRRSIEAADAALNAEVANYDGMLVALTAEVARAYITIRTFEERIRIAEKNINIQQRSFKITTINFENGNTTELDMQQAKSLLYNTEAAIPVYRLGLGQTQHALSILLGQPPRKLSTLLQGAAVIPTVPARVEIGVPADLLRRRPDIQQAEFLAMAQCANIGVAKSALYPHFSLIGNIGFSAINSGDKSLNNFLNSDSIGFTFGPAMKWDIFNYGRLKNQIRAQDARFEQAIMQYQQVVLDAAREVEDAMIAFRQTHVQTHFLGKSVAASRRAAEISRLQYREGVIDFQRVLDTDRYLTSQEDSYIQAKGDIALYLVALYKALGGGWQMRLGHEFVPEEIQQKMVERTDWGRILEVDEQIPEDALNN